MKGEVTYTFHNVDSIDNLKNKINKIKLNVLFIVVEDFFTLIVTFDRHLTEEEEIFLYTHS